MFLNYIVDAPPNHRIICKCGWSSPLNMFDIPLDSRGRVYICTALRRLTGARCSRVRSKGYRNFRRANIGDPPFRDRADWPRRNPVISADRSSPSGRLGRPRSPIRCRRFSPVQLLHSLHPLDPLLF